MQLGPRTPHVEDTSTSTATHATHDPDPEQDQQHNGAKTPNQVREITAVLILNFTVKRPCGTPLFNTLFKLVGRRNVGGNHSFLIALSHIFLTEHLLSQVVGQEGLGFILIAVNDNFRHTFLLHPGAKVGPAHTLASTGVAGIIDGQESQEDDNIHPVDAHVETSPA